MKMIMNDQRLNTVEEVALFLQGNLKVEFTLFSIKERTEWLESSLKRFNYKRKTKKEKGILRQYFTKIY